MLQKIGFQYVAKYCQIKLKLAKIFVKIKDSLFYLKTKTMIFEKKQKQ